jgi:hypothetical protein
MAREPINKLAAVTVPRRARSQRRYVHLFDRQRTG